jgi:hypothetical protein
LRTHTKIHCPGSNITHPHQSANFPRVDIFTTIGRWPETGIFSVLP